MTSTTFANTDAGMVVLKALMPIVYSRWFNQMTSTAFANTVAGMVVLKALIPMSVGCTQSLYDHKTVLASDDSFT